MFSQNPQVLSKDLHAEQCNKQILANFSSALIFFASFFSSSKKMKWDYKGKALVKHTWFEGRKNI